MMKLPLPVIQSPRLRQSSVYDWRSCPRKFLLRHRCNLTGKGFKYSSALGVGTFFHDILESFYKTGAPDGGLTSIDARIAKQLVEAAEFGHNVDTLAIDLAQDKALAQAMADLHWEMFPLDRDKFELVACEAVVRTYWGEGIPDVLLRHKRTGEYWFLDHKTEGRDGLVRSAPITFELQPRLYKKLIEEALGIKVTGVVHNIVVKPTIRFGMEDRPFALYDHVLKSGPRKGQVEKRKEFLSDVPEYTNYLQRVRDFMLAEGEYFMEKDSRELNPMLVQSWVRFPDKGEDRELQNELATVMRAAGHYQSEKTDPAQGEQWDIEYPRHDQSCRSYGRLCEFISLCTTDPAKWPEIVGQFYQQRGVDERYAEE